MFKTFIAIPLLWILALKATLGMAQDRVLAASIAIIPSHSEFSADGKPRGGFVDVVEAVGEMVQPRYNVKVELLPFARSLKKVEQGLSDFHIPLIRVPHSSEEPLNFAYVTERITQVSFVLYTRADSKRIDRSQIGAYSLETIRGHRQLFQIDISEIDSISQGIGKLLAGRTDGFIMEQEAVDQFIREHRIENIRRALFATWDSCIVIAKGEKQKHLDEVLSSALRELKSSQRLNEITSHIHRPYDNWQPYLNQW